MNQTQPNTWDLNAWFTNQSETLIQQLDSKLKADMKALKEQIFSPNRRDLDDETTALSPAATSGSSATDGTKLSTTPYQANSTAITPKAPTLIPSPQQSPAPQQPEIEISLFPYTKTDFPDLFFYPYITHLIVDTEKPPHMLDSEVKAIKLTRTPHPPIMAMDTIETTQKFHLEDERNNPMTSPGNELKKTLPDPKDNHLKAVIANRVPHQKHVNANTSAHFLAHLFPQTITTNQTDRNKRSNKETPPSTSPNQQSTKNSIEPITTNETEDYKMASLQSAHTKNTQEGAEKNNQHTIGTGIGNSVPHRKHTLIKDLLLSSTQCVLPAMTATLGPICTLVFQIIHALLHLHNNQHHDQAPSCPIQGAIYDAHLLSRNIALEMTAQIIAQLNKNWTIVIKQEYKAPPKLLKSRPAVLSQTTQIGKTKTTWIQSNDLTSTNPIDRGPKQPLFN